MGEQQRRPRLILASASPRRQALLTEAGYEFVVEPAHIDEAKYPEGALPSDVARYLAGEKARVVAERFPEDVVLAADTVVAFGDQMLGKAKDVEDARRILSVLMGTTHIVITGVAVIHRSANFSRTAKVMSAVRMKWITAQQLEAYLASGEWQGKAGAYGIQDADPFVTRVTGSQSNIVGLPMRAARVMLAEAGIEARKREGGGAGEVKS